MRRTGIFLSLLAVCALAAPLPLTGFSPGLIEWARERWGARAIDRLQNWQKLQSSQLGDAAEMVSRDPRAGAASPLAQINRFFNRVPYIAPAQYWGGENYWATPVEMLGGNSAFCVHYATSKYLSLKELRIPIERMRITYVRAKEQNEWHMVLAYYPTPDADPLILDNLTGEIKPASQRPDLVPVYSFNDDDMWVGGATRKGGGTQVRQWKEVLIKIENERQM